MHFHPSPMIKSLTLFLLVIHLWHLKASYLVIVIWINDHVRQVIISDVDNYNSRTHPFHFISRVFIQGSCQAIFEMNGSKNSGRLQSTSDYYISIYKFYLQLTS